MKLRAIHNNNFTSIQIDPRRGCESMMFEPFVSVDKETHGNNGPDSKAPSLRLTVIKTLIENKDQAKLLQDAITLARGIFQHVSESHDLDGEYLWLQKHHSDTFEFENHQTVH